jgi:carboxyl-terminal processing protease
MSVSRKLLFAVLAAFSVGLTTFAAGYLAAGGPQQGDTDGEVSFGRDVEPGQGLGVIADAFEQIRASAVAPPSEQALVRGALRGMIKVLKKKDDPYALFYTPKGYKSIRELTTGQFSGIGVWVKPQGDELEIVSVLPSTPALKAGLKPGDVIQSIDGTPVSGMTSDEAVARIKGPEGSSVDLVVKRNDATLDFSLTRADIELPNLEAKLTADGFAYIRLFGFARGAGEQLRGEVEALVDGGAKGVILDLRDNGGGLFSEAVDVASVFIEDDDVVIYRERSNDDVVYEAEGDAFEDIPTVVLVNEGTASASEIVAGALQDSERAIVVGTTTYGKGSVQQIVPLADSSALKLTTAAYLTPSGRNIDGQGIEPDVEVDAADGQRSRAVEILHGIVLSTTDSQG